jgi:hypothetical protein
MAGLHAPLKPASVTDGTGALAGEILLPRPFYCPQGFFCTAVGSKLADWQQGDFPQVWAVYAPGGIGLPSQFLLLFY